MRSKYAWFLWICEQRYPQIQEIKSGRYLQVEKPRFLDNFVENEVLRLLEPVAEQRVYLFRVENAEKMICKIMRAFCSTQPKMRHLY